MSATLTVWKFDTAEGAGDAAELLKKLSQQDLIHIHDAAIVTYPEGAKKPKTRRLWGSGKGNFKSGKGEATAVRG